MLSIFCEQTKSRTPTLQLPEMAAYNIIPFFMFIFMKMVQMRFLLTSRVSFMQPETRTVWLHSVLVFFSGVIQNMLLCLVGGFAVNKLL